MALDVVILGAIDEDPGDLSSEVVRAKAALLYGDRVSLASHKLPLLVARMAFKSRLAPGAIEAVGGIDQDLAEGIAQTIERRVEVALPTSDLAARNLDAVLRLLRSNDPNAVFALPEFIASAIREKGPDQQPPDKTALMQATARVSVENYLRSNEQLEPAVALRAIDELFALSRGGLVDVDWGESHDIDSAELDDVTASFNHAISQAVAILTDATRREHPLFTRSTRLALRGLREGGGLEGADFTHANRVELAARLVTAVPTFPDATVDEVLDLRERVKPHLARFRAAVADFEDELNADVLADEFDRAVDDIRQRQVEPALQELRESLRDSGAVPTLTRGVPTMASSTLALGASLAIGAYELAGVAAVAAGAATTVAKEVLERRRQAGEQRKNRLFLLFEAERALNR